MNAQSIEIIGAPFDLGANVRGARLGPGALRLANLKRELQNLGHQVKDGGDISCSNELAYDTNVAKSVTIEDRIEVVLEICESLAQRSYQACLRDEVPLMLGGDHSFAMGSLKGVAHAMKEKKKKLGVIWVDAHADLNTTEASQTSNLHGMPLSVLLGHGNKSLRSILAESTVLEPKFTILIGIRDLDPFEQNFCKELGIHYFTMRSLDELGICEVMKRSLDFLAECDGIHVSFDIDGVDPFYAPGVSTRVLGGLNYREAHLAMEMIADENKLVGMDAVELNSLNDERNKTAEVFVDFIASAFGKRIC